MDAPTTILIGCRDGVMVELTERQARAMEDSGEISHLLANPRTRETFVLIRADEYERLKKGLLRRQPWTRDELEALGWEASERS